MWAGLFFLTSFIAGTCESKDGVFSYSLLGTAFADGPIDNTDSKGVERNCYAGTHLMGRPERRKYGRLPMKLALSCTKVGPSKGTLHKGCTVNVSPGGLYFRTTAAALEPGSLVRVELSIPPTTGVLELGGQISAFAKVLRTHSMNDFRTSTDLSSDRCGVAVEFCNRPTLAK